MEMQDATPTPHIGAKKGDFAPTMLMPGDPLRAKFIAETFLENPVLVTSVRNVLGYTGTYQGKRVSVMASGMGIPSIGFSLCDHDPDADFTPLTDYVQGITRQVLRHGLPEGVCLNVNFPLAPRFNGVKVCRQTRGQWQQEWVPCPRPHKADYYWLTGSFHRSEMGEDSDAWALEHGYVAITPVKTDVTAYEMLDRMKEWNLKF